jgi:hypothetical protein
MPGCPPPSGSSLPWNAHPGARFLSSAMPHP